jgi:hypothetical protein
VSLYKGDDRHFPLHLCPKQDDITPAAADAANENENEDEGEDEDEF